MRFPEFNGEWRKGKVSELFTINVGGDIAKETVSEKQDEKHPFAVVANALSNDGIYGYTKEYKDDAPSITVTGRGDVGFAKCRNYPIYPIVRLLVLHSKGSIDCKFGEHAINKIKKYDESTGVPQLTAPQLGAYSIFYPELDEQTKIGELMSLIEQRIQTQIGAIEDLKLLIRGITQSVCNSAGVKMILLGELLTERNEKNYSYYEVYSVAVNEGVVNQIEHLGRSFSAADTSHYNVVHHGDIVYTKSPTGEFPYGIVKRSETDKCVAVSPLYGVYQPATENIAIWLHHYFESPTAANNYLHKLIQKGAKNTINITNQRFLENNVPIPTDYELDAYCKGIELIEKKLRLARGLLEAYRQQKSYLMKHMFV